MHVHVLNGVNLGMLGTREPDVYGKMALNELESRVYAWARELGLTARCMQTDHEGEYVQAIHEAIRTAGALIVNPGRVDALLLRDPRRARDALDSDRRGAHERRRTTASRGAASP